MMPHSLHYRRATLQQASTVGLVIALYDTLAGNLGRAAAAIERGDIEGRCAELVHGFKVLQQLDAMLDMKNGGVAATNLRRFYTHLRGQMLSAQFRLSASILRDQVRALIDVRGAWQQVDSRGAGGAHSIAFAGQPASEASASVSRVAAYEPEETPVGIRSFSCSG